MSVTLSFNWKLEDDGNWYLWITSKLKGYRWKSGRILERTDGSNLAFFRSSTDQNYLYLGDYPSRVEAMEAVEDVADVYCKQGN